MLQELQDMVGEVQGDAAVYARRLDIDEEIAVGEVDEAFPTGSAAKLFVLLAFAHAAVAGEIDPMHRVEISASYRDERPGSGVLRFLQPGLRPTLDDCATLMMIVSDNVATDLVLDAIGGPASVNRALHANGEHDAAITSPSVWAIPPAQFGTASPRALASTWSRLAEPGPVAERCRTITWRHQHREGFARFVPFSPDLPDFGLVSPLRLWSKSGAYPTVSCEGGLFETDAASWVLAVMAKDLSDWGSGSVGAGPTLRARVSERVFGAWSGTDG